MTNIIPFSNHARLPLVERLSAFRDKVLWELENYAYNCMEICRLFNGLDPFKFRGCHFTTKEKPWGTSKGGCRGRVRGCKLLNSTLYSRLRRLEELGKVKSIKLLWFDGRNPEKAGIKLDQFRFFYVNRDGLAARLHQDVGSHISPTYAW